MRNLWRPLGRVFSPAAGEPWCASHAANPTALALADGNVRIFFSTRDTSNRSSAASVDIAIDGDRFEMLGRLRGPLLTPGARGSFDADGVTVSSVVSHDGKLYAFYLGWTVLVHVPFTNFIGVAVSDDGKTFRRGSSVPVVGRSPENPLSVGYPIVLRDGPGWRMWFGSHLHWGQKGLEMLHVIKEARSPDLVQWTPSDAVVVDVAGPTDPLEFAISRPSLLREPDGSLSMWYARRRPHYELGFARSTDGARWERRDQDLIFVGTPEAWEDKERTYPFVFDHGGRRYMLYNGNGYGREGFGLAILEQ
ncbi:hypothetical protein LMTR13_10695 [Bradyrhizobium icense]|uniref:Glycosyl hydrolase family 32 N-terminal domain-containing protein n=1 Tax=Bradyrhizobium icense TaxID=1274631 RepID=A0A1B1UCT2_9BRAD|nr:hypothetical protein LMTR13_10695 [Bradyrhizobium icense]